MQNVYICENKKGTATRYGKKGNWVIPEIPALACANLRKTNFSDEWFTVENNRVETPFYSVEFNNDGSIASLYDKEFSREWVNGDFNKLKIYVDCPGNYDAWDILPNYREKEIAVNVVKPVTLVESDGECATFSVTLGTEKSTWEMKIRFFRRGRGIEVENNVNWNEKHKLAKAEFQ